MTNASRLRVIPLMMLALAASALAQTVSGTVTNGSTHRPAAGIEVTLVDPMAGMAEVGTARTDSQGRFSLSPSSPPQGPRLVRATKDGVNYFKMVPPGVPSADLEVYDSASSLEGISTVVEVLRLQGSSDILQADALYAVHNDSNPPRTLAAKSTYEITLPAGAVIDRASVQGPGGQPIGTTATPLAQKNHYGFSYPLKPGENPLPDRLPHALLRPGRHYARAACCAAALCGGAAREHEVDAFECRRLPAHAEPTRDECAGSSQSAVCWVSRLHRLRHGDDCRGPRGTKLFRLRGQLSPRRRARSPD